MNIDKNLIPDKSKLVDIRGNPLTQSLFLEIGYTEYSVYTLKEDHHEYGGKIFPSLKKLYIDFEDPLDYTFASTYLLSYSHWKRLLGNKIIKSHIDVWKEELELKLRSQAVMDMLSLSASEGGNFSATKWLADNGWAKRLAGRPSKSEKDKESAIQDRISDEYSEDLKRLSNFRVVK